MRTGKINKVIIDGQEELTGYIKTLNLELNFKLKKNESKGSSNAPDYSIMSIGANGEVAVGAVWVKSFNHGLELKEFFSMTFDDPSFPHSLNVAAFKAGESHWDITWRRRKAAEAIPMPPTPLSADISNNSNIEI